MGRRLRRCDGPNDQVELEILGPLRATSVRPEYCTTPQLVDSVRLRGRRLTQGVRDRHRRGSRRDASFAHVWLNDRGSQGNHAVPAPSLLMSARRAVSPRHSGQTSTAPEHPNHATPMSSAARRPRPIAPRDSAERAYGARGATCPSPRPIRPGVWGRRRRRSRAPAEPGRLPLVRLLGFGVGIEDVRRLDVRRAGDRGGDVGRSLWLRRRLRCGGHRQLRRCCLRSRRGLAGGGHRQRCPRRHRGSPRS